MKHVAKRFFSSPVTSFVCTVAVSFSTTSISGQEIVQFVQPTAHAAANDVVARPAKARLGVRRESAQNSDAVKPIEALQPSRGFYSLSDREEGASGPLKPVARARTPAARTPDAQLTHTDAVQQTGTAVLTLAPEPVVHRSARSISEPSPTPVASGSEDNSRVQLASSKVDWSVRPLFVDDAKQIEASPSDRSMSTQDLIRAEAEAYGIRPITDVTASIAIPGGGATPEEESKSESLFELAGVEFQPMGFNRAYGLYEFNWVASNLCHQPLYFEEAALERSGYSYGVLQPLCSAAHFFGRIPLIPYMRGAENPRECNYVLGSYRPGSYAPYSKTRLPLSVKGGIYEAAAAVGLVYLIP